eukprot:s2356_g3.t1
MPVDQPGRAGFDHPNPKSLLKGTGPLSHLTGHQRCWKDQTVSWQVRRTLDLSDLFYQEENADLHVPFLIHSLIWPQGILEPSTSVFQVHSLWYPKGISNSRVSVGC